MNEALKTQVRGSEATTDTRLNHGSAGERFKILEQAASRPIGEIGLTHPSKCPVKNHQGVAVLGGHPQRIGGGL